jgi:hypothetical protein
MPSHPRTAISRADTRLRLRSAASLAVLITLAVAPVRYVELVPGPTFNTLGSSGAPGHHDQWHRLASGQLRMLTVGEIDNLTAYNVVGPHSTAVLPREG